MPPCVHVSMCPCVHVHERVHEHELLHVAGLLKPLMHTLRSGRLLLTPKLPEFTAVPPCASRDLSCFFEPLAPACDGAMRAVGGLHDAVNTATPDEQRQGIERRRGVELVSMPQWVDAQQARDPPPTPRVAPLSPSRVAADRTAGR